jgi:predicted O-methyltransferase YrrM
MPPVATKVRAFGNLLRLCLMRRSERVLHLFNLLTSVHDAGLPRIGLVEFQKRLLAKGRISPSHLKLHLQLTGCGSGSTAEMAALASLVAIMQPRNILEFGTCDGASTWHLWANAPEDARITTIDLPSGTKVNGSSDNGLQGITARPLLPTDARTRLVEIDSRNWCPDVSDVEFCFIDAGHSYECVKNDTEKALSVMSQGGLLLWHDASWRHNDYRVNDYLKEIRRAGRDVLLLETNACDYCALAVLAI